MRTDTALGWIIGLVIVVVFMLALCMDQGDIIQRQRTLIDQMTHNPACMVDGSPPSR